MFPGGGHNDDRPPGAGDEPEAHHASRPSSRASEPRSPGSQTEEAPTQEQRLDCLIAGPVSTGKTRYLSKLPDACATLNPGEPEMLFSHTDSLAPLIVKDLEKHRQRIGLDATTSAQHYDFSIEVNELDGKTNAVQRRLGARTFRCMDGPGGALFYDNPATPNLSGEMLRFREDLLRSGRTATSLVFFVDPVSEPERATVTGNLAQLFGALAVRVQMQPVDADRNGRGWVGHIWPFGRAGRERDPVPPPPPQYAWKLEADRVPFVLNRIDQLCVLWQAAWQRARNPNSRYSAYQIAQLFAKPAELAIKVLGVPFLQKVRGFLKPDAVLAAAVCSAGGFIRDTGDPFLDREGKPNLLKGVPPQVLETRLKLYGVRETMLFAGFGVMTPGVIEAVTRGLLARAAGGY